MHEHMAIDVDEAVELTSVPEKITVIYPTYQAPIECLLWSTFSLLLRANVKDLIEHFMVIINGPDNRTGDPSIQNLKQEFLEDLRKLQWWNISDPKSKRDMPISILRVWSRIGHPEAVEMAMPWVHTDGFLIMHDDIIIKKHNWLTEVRNKFYGNPNVVIAFSPVLMCCQCDSNSHKNRPLLRFPHLLCAFLVCKKKLIRKLGSSWCGYHIETDPFLLKDKVGDVDEFMQYYKKIGLLDNPPQTDKLYEVISMEMGAWHFYNACQAGMEFAQLDPDLIAHFGAASWDTPSGVSKRIESHKETIKELEKEIYAHPDYGPLYNKYLPYKYK
jgi:hypothetical protein